MRKIVINTCHGGFSLSKEACFMLRDLGVVEFDETQNYFEYEVMRQLTRDNPSLIQVIEKLGVESASGGLSSLKIVEIPADVDWVIEEYDGSEWIAEKHRSWS